MTNSNLSEAWEKIKLDFMAAAGAIALKAVQENAPVDTGAFRDSFRPEVTLVGDDVLIEVTTDSEKPQLVWITEGTAPHSIFTNTAKVLAFTASDGTDVFSHSVFHPGTKPNDFDYRAMEEMTPLLQDLLDTMIEESL